MSNNASLLADVDDNSQMSFDLSLLATRRLITSTPKRPPAPPRGGGVNKLKEALMACGLKLINLPMDIYQCFLDSGVSSVESLCPSVVVQFFRDFERTGSSCQLGSVPIALRATPLRDEATLAAVLQYCMRDSEYLLEHLHGLPLLLCEDGQIRVFSSDDPVYLTEFTDLLPECNSMFVHHSVSKTAFSGLDPAEHAVFQRFDVPAFASLLPNVLSEAWYRKENEHAEWVRDNDDTLPTSDWIWMVWNFLRSEYERIMDRQEPGAVAEEDVVRGVLKPLEEWCLLPAQLQVRLSFIHVLGNGKGQGQSIS